MKYALSIFMCFFLLNVFGQQKNDEQKFSKVFLNFKTAVKKQNFTEVMSLLHFPFFTSKFDNGDGRDLPVDAISKAEFITYKTDIFYKDVLRILPKLDKNSVSEVTGNKEIYYTTLYKTVDPGSKLYEMYVEYREQARDSESYFAFLFGRIKGQYKVIASYSKWPVK